ncbi:MAG: TerC/Alx family metal homeostasis membrane protein [Planctomycetes bacterium]|nr:TerC/Alx family metal homeostasis membrane protein [Planctomycetota bacterium]
MPDAVLVFIVIVAGLLALDLGVFHRKAHKVSMLEAVGWTIFWMACALLFNVGIWAAYEHHWFGLIPRPDLAHHPADAMDAALQFLTGYGFEKALSLDNIFVIAVTLRFFRIPEERRHRLLFWGIIGAVVLRGLFIYAGIALVEKFTWLFTVMGIVLIISGLKLFFAGESDDDPEQSRIYRFFTRRLRVAEGDHGARFLVRQGGKLFATRMLVALLMIEVSDVIFAIDSIPVIFGITLDPFIVLSSNIFAILGLRSLFFVLERALVQFKHLKRAVTVILVFIGLKMALHEYLPMPTWVSLTVLGASVAVGIALSLRTRPTPAH